MRLRLVFLTLFLSCSGGVWADVASLLMPGEVIKGHAKLEAKCAECHVQFDKEAQTRLCKNCHKEVGADVLNRKGFHGRLEEKECRVCHTDHKGRDASIVIFDTGKFDHTQADFQLKGGHLSEKVKCKDCHRAKEKYREAPSDCNACHKKDDVHKGKLGEKCASCHSEKDWKEKKFDHDKTKLPLAGGKHEDVKCKECHLDRGYKNAPLECNACHKKLDQEKAHKGRYGTKCESCHTDKGWKELRFNHLFDTHYVLRGKHQTAKCDSCHLPEKGPIYQAKLPVKCVACHKKDDKEKGHKGGLGEKCESCHNEKGWKTLSFDHDNDTKYPLRGKHKTAKCDVCHKGEIHGKDFKLKLKLEKECVACHKKDDQEKGHKGRYGNRCEACHSEKDWKTLTFDHDRDTRYRLLGKHLKPECDDCHLPAKGPIYQKKLEAQCVACHKKDDQEKGHKERYGNKCEACHSEKEWKTITFDHDRDTKYRLRDKHLKPKCDDCHLPAKGPVYQKKLETQCIACHKKDDKHNGQLGNKCESCHNEKLWKDAPYDHAKARFQLTGSHIKTECKKCHLTPAFRDASSACNGCHEKEDVHKKSLGLKCENCHNTRSWKSWDFNHDRTKFKLDGGHKKTKCADCHRGPMETKFKNPQTCGSCHVKDDVHNSGFGPQCERCHTADDWREFKRN